VNIRRRLRSLIIATLVPLVVFGLGGAYVLAQRERDTFERSARDRVRALMTAIDTELGASVAALEVLAQSPSLTRGDLAAFRADAERALAARRTEWVNILVSDPSNAQMLMNLLLPPDAPMPAPGDAATVLEAARSVRSTVSQIVQPPLLKRPLFGVRLPVVRDGSVKYVISAMVDPEAVARIVERQGFPTDWTVAVLDGNFRFVARNPLAEGGEFASESLKQALQSTAEGCQRGRPHDGTEIFRAYPRSSRSDWSASLALPRSIVDRSLTVVWLLMAGFVAAGAIGLFIAWRLAKRISTPITALAHAAPALGRGEVSALPDAGPIDEVRDLSRALGEASAAVRDREERQRVAEQALRAADRAKDEFLAMLGHELRNPLASVSNAAQLLHIARHDQAAIDNVSEILTRQVQHMTRLVDDLLEVGRVTGGKVRLERAPIDLGRLVGDITRMLASAGRFRHHVVEVDLAEVWVSADRARIEQVVTNLVDNALKYTPARGRIDIVVRRKDAAARFVVKDTGEGIAPELIGRIFDLFVQGERDLARPTGGLGIGLTMAKRLVELHGGRIRARSDGPGKGATFIVELPAIERVAAPVERPAADVAKPAPLRILVVEDNRDARESLATLLRIEGHEVVEAENGAGGVALAQTSAPDFALVDIGLPDIDGYEVARRLRDAPATRGIGLVAVTGYGTQEDLRRALAAGFDVHLAKPVEVAQLLDILATLREAR
jgi:signal transduction histidine kinase/ActR/RegA family two-component response regulator